MPFYPLLSLHFSENVPPVCPSTCPSTTQNRPFRAQKKGAVKLPEQPKIIPKIPPKSSSAYNTIRTPSEHPENCVLSPHSSLTDTSSIRPPEMSVDCFIIARFVHTVPFPPSPAWSRYPLVAPTSSAVSTVYTAEMELK